MDDIDETAAAFLFEVKKNQLKMVRRRGYIIKDEESLFQLTLQQFLDAYVPFARERRQSVRAILSRPYFNDEGQKLIVYYADKPKTTQQLGIESLQNAIAMCEKNKSKNLILISPVALSSASSKEIEKLLTFNIHVFMENEMTYDPTEHFLTPDHRALTVEEQRDLLVKNNFSIDQCPIILTTDMIVRYYGFKPGQVIEIHRINLYDTIVPESLTYRVVKENPY